MVVEAQSVEKCPMKYVLVFVDMAPDAFFCITLVQRYIDAWLSLFYTLVMCKLAWC